MAGQYFATRPCPPWNDELLHHYTSCCTPPTSPAARSRSIHGQQVKAALEGHVLAEARLTEPQPQSGRALKLSAPRAVRRRKRAWRAAESRRPRRAPGRRARAGSPGVAAAGLHALHALVQPAITWPAPSVNTNGDRIPASCRSRGPSRRLRRVVQHHCNEPSHANPQRFRAGAGHEVRDFESFDRPLRW